MDALYIKTRLQAIKDIASASCNDEKDADNICDFCDEIYEALSNTDSIIEEFRKQEVFLEPTFSNPCGSYIPLEKAIEIVKQRGVTND